MIEWIIEHGLTILGVVFAGGSFVITDIQRQKSIDKSVNNYLDEKLLGKSKKKKEEVEKK